MSLQTKIARIKLRQHEKAILELMRSKGIPKNLIEEIPMEFADRKLKPGEEYYVYTGPLDEKTRPFCKKLLSIDKVISSLDIDILSNYLDYDVLQYKGSYNCRHKWRKFRGKFILTPELTVGQIKDLVRRGIQG